ncbi:MAG TPA: sulfur oxidation c-type cytochrome SoxA, partial [Gammaproteobacteria bacterium]|nr:sulfur oxidation c-type cytochrome SoxA [Gammaproteobacteria bacterium]
MRKIIMAITALSALVAAPLVGAATTPQEDLENFRSYYMKKFPGVPLQEYANGVYAVNESLREEWEMAREFPPYDFGLDVGEELFNERFANGKSYADCFENGGMGVRQDYPYYDNGRQEVVTLPMAINECRQKNGEEPLGWKKGKMAALVAYMAYTSRGNPIDIEVPNEDAVEWYKEGKKFFYAKRGQLNLSCANCHKDYAGQRIRANILSPALGQVTHFPVYRKKWEAK